MKHARPSRRFRQLPRVRNRLPGRTPLRAAGVITSDNLRLSAPTHRVLTKGVLACLAATHAANTRRAYAGDEAAFARAGGRIPCTDAELAAFLATHAPQWSPNTLRRRVAGIGHAHRARGLPDPTRSPLVRDVLRGLRRLHGRPPRQAAPVSWQELEAALGATEGMLALRDRALLLLGFASGLRRSELVALDVADLTWADAGVLLRIGRSKGDQAGAGRNLAVAARAEAPCPVQALRMWLEAGAITAGPVFRPLSKAGRVQPRRLAAASVARILKRHAPALHHAAADLSGHSLRAGFATSAARAGVPLQDIQQQTGHRSPAMVARYIRHADVFAGTRRLWAMQPKHARTEAASLSDAAILAAATAILQRRLERLGTLTDPAEAAAFLRMRLGGETNEVFYVLYLDNRHAILAAEAAFSGTIDQAEVHPRVLVRRALELNAAALICAHNHPSGNAEPSAADRALTGRLKQALALVDIRLLDHIVVTAGACTSLAARGWV